MVELRDLSSTPLDVRSAIERFELCSGMRSQELIEQFEDGRFGRLAWARVWAALLR